MGTHPVYVEGRNCSTELELGANCMDNSQWAVLIWWEIEIPVAFYFAFTLDRFF